jgi:hypothetical protein
MALKNLLEKMKLVELEEPAAEAAAPQRPAMGSPPPPARRPPLSGATARPSLADVVKSLPETAPPLDAAALPAAPGGGIGEIPDFPAIYKASGVTDPAHGYSAHKVLEMLSSPDFAALEPRAKAAALAGFLKMNPSGPVPITDVIQDAVRRDQALDGFEQFLGQKLEERRAQLDQENEKLQAEIDQLLARNRERMDQNRRALEAEKERFATWQARKRIEERRLADAVAPFVEENPVTLGGAQAAPKPAGR